MIKKINRSLTLITIIVILMLIGFLSIIKTFTKADSLSVLFDNSLISSSIINLEDDWNMRSENNIEKVEQIQFPKRFKYDKGNVISFSRNITGDFSVDDDMLCIQTDISNFIVYVDNIKIYDYYDFKYDKPLNKSLNKIHLIRIPNNFRDKNIKIKFRMCSGTNTSYNIRKICIGSKVSILYSIIKNEIPSMIFVIASLILGIIVILFSITGLLKKEDEELSLLFFVGLFTLIGSIYVFSNTNTIQIFLKNVYTINTIKYVSLLFLPINFLVLIILNTPKEKNKLLYVFFSISIVNFIFQILLTEKEITDYKSNIDITRLLIIAVFFITIFIQLRYWRGEKKLFLISTLPIMFTAILEILIKHFSNLIRGGILEIGILVFISINFSHTINEYFKYLKKSMQTDVFKELAYIDKMTDVGNRVSYEQKITSINDKRDSYLSIWCFSFDINNLKTVNDTLGHSSGDMLIIGFANVFKKTFKNKGDCFRTGGDEFVAITYNMKEEDVAEIIDYFYKNLVEHNTVTEPKLSVAVGFKKYNKETDKNINQTLMKSDKLMYRNKILVKKQHNMKIR
ncbi:GGDEF domain-containing protein [Clostridium sp. BJN0001]|uniref:GGDEF domain-containing protein n=1 Tax=Clostridium sp. BJN0001 TaxID=2930219 RepID=UPI001FD1CC07|nr:GGDEF domain-containing protein [Clostridium sp. BJN0001]